ncbi:uncharacterized protein LOC121431383 isoform X2 [Lytechinus variegatus]|uniref:uncharacterized protein LOC121431383 isoform X2 n=1 Tax=Lytechinus variegatus TaxID=7654 RepID=UPI001BB25228|nr:uncharacterized protein LOC121431383 isoform X2 [Lytechinus variegatus]
MDTVMNYEWTSSRKFSAHEWTSWAEGNNPPQHDYEHDDPPQREYEDDDEHDEWDLSVDVHDFSHDNALNYMIGITAIVGVVVTSITALTIACHRRIRNKRFIFAFNIILADFLVDTVVSLQYVVIKALADGRSDGLFRAVEFLMPVLFQSSNLVSTANVLLVAVDQFIAFKIDPFGTKNILTTSRRIIISFSVWAAMIGLSVLSHQMLQTRMDLVRICSCNFFIIVTGVCYALVYRTIAKTPLTSDGSQLQERKKKTKRVMRIYSLILLASLILYTLPDVIMVIVYYIGVSYNTMLWIQFSRLLPLTVNTLVNACIYWWRMIDVRDIFTCTSTNHM